MATLYMRFCKKTLNKLERNQNAINQFSEQKNGYFVCI